MPWIFIARTSSVSRAATLVLILAIAIAGRAVPAAAQIDAAGGPPAFDDQIIHQAGQTVFGFASGEFDPTHAGVEVALLARDSAVIQLSATGGTWSASPRTTGTFVFPLFAMTDRPTISIGDVDQQHAGNEIVVQGGGTLTSNYRDAMGNWQREDIADLSFLFGVDWGARIGDLDLDHPGDEVFLIFEGVADFSYGSMYRNVGGTWEVGADGLYLAEVGMDSAIGDVDPTHAGPELIVATEMGPTYQIPVDSPIPPGQWPGTTIWDNFDESAWVVEIADVDPATPGNEIVYGTRYSNRITLSRRNPDGTHAIQILHTGAHGGGIDNNIWDIDVGDILPESDSLEIVGVDHTGSVYLVWKDNGVWQGGTIHQRAGDPQYAVAVGDFLPGSPGDEIVVAGESGVVTLLTRASTFVEGDLDCNNAIQPADAAAMALALTDLDAYNATYPGCSAARGDLNHDGATDGDDVSLFVALLLAP